MKKTLVIAAACSSMLMVGQAWSFGMGGAPRSNNNPDYGQGYYDQAPYGDPGSRSGGGFGGGPGAGNPGYGRGYGPGGPGYGNPGSGSGGGFGGGPRGQQPGPGYGGYQQGGPGGYNSYQQPPQGYAPPQGYGYQQGAPYGYGGQQAPQGDYDIPRDAYGQQYHHGQGGYPQGQAPGYSGNPGYAYPPPPPPGYGDDYYRDRGDKKSGGFPNPMNMMGNPMKMFGGDKDRD